MGVLRQHKMSKVAKARKGEPIKLFTRATVLGYRRSKVVQYPQWSLLRLDGVKSKEDTDFYLGKRVAYVYKASRARRVEHRKNAKEGETTKIRVIWGRVCRPHGNNGVVRARFRKNLPPKSFGSTVRVMLYPSRV